MLPVSYKSAVVGVKSNSSQLSQHRLISPQLQFYRSSLNFPIPTEMTSPKFVFFLLLSAITLVGVSFSKGIGEHENFPADLSQLMDDDGSLDTALINYLFARQMIKRLQNSMDVTDLQRKRSYWKQCAFNAVSCFGK